MTTSIDVFPSRSRFNQSLYTMFLSCNKIDAHSNSFLTESAGSNPVKRTLAFLAEWFTQLTENQSFSMLEASSLYARLRFPVNPFYETGFGNPLVDFLKNFWYNKYTS